MRAIVSITTADNDGTAAADHAAISRSRSSKFLHRTKQKITTTGSDAAVNGQKKNKNKPAKLSKIKNGNDDTVQQLTPRRSRSSIWKHPKSPSDSRIEVQVSPREEDAAPFEYDAKNQGGVEESPSMLDNFLAGCSMGGSSNVNVEDEQGQQKDNAADNDAPDDDKVEEEEKATEKAGNDDNKDASPAKKRSFFGGKFGKKSKQTDKTSSKSKKATAAAATTTTAAVVTAAAIANKSTTEADSSELKGALSSDETYVVDPPTTSKKSFFSSRNWLIHCDSPRELRLKPATKRGTKTKEQQPEEETTNIGDVASSNKQDVNDPTEEEQTDNNNNNNKDRRDDSSTVYASMVGAAAAIGIGTAAAAASSQGNNDGHPEEEEKENSTSSNNKKSSTKETADHEEGTKVTKKRSFLGYEGKKKDKGEADHTSREHLPEDSTQASTDDEVDDCASDGETAARDNKTSKDSRTATCCLPSRKDISSSYNAAVQEFDAVYLPKMAMAMLCLVPEEDSIEIGHQRGSRQRNNSNRRSEVVVE